VGSASDGEGEVFVFFCKACEADVAAANCDVSTCSWVSVEEAEGGLGFFLDFEDDLLDRVVCFSQRRCKGFVVFCYAAPVLLVSGGAFQDVDTHPRILAPLVVPGGVCEEGAFEVVPNFCALVLQSLPAEVEVHSIAFKPENKVAEEGGGAVVVCRVLFDVWAPATAC